MARKRKLSTECKRVELDGIRYVIVREALFDRLCKAAGIEEAPNESSKAMADSSLDLEPASLAEKLIRRRTAAGLSQAELARRAGIRAETLNRIERGRTNPDFATVRKLVNAINATELEGTGL